MDRSLRGLNLEHRQSSAAVQRLAKQIAEQLKDLEQRHLGRGKWGIYCPRLMGLWLILGYPLMDSGGKIHESHGLLLLEETNLLMAIE